MDGQHSFLVFYKPPNVDFIVVQNIWNHFTWIIKGNVSANEVQSATALCLYWKSGYRAKGCLIRMHWKTEFQLQCIDVQNVWGWKGLASLWRGRCRDFPLDPYWSRLQESCIVELAIPCANSSASGVYQNSTGFSHLQSGMPSLNWWLDWGLSLWIAAVVKRCPMYGRVGIQSVDNCTVKRCPT